MPTPQTGESRDEFLARCMADPEANTDFPDPAQRYAFCNSQWERRAMTMEELLAKLKSRNGGERFGYGLTTADAYVSQAIKAVGTAVASRYFGDVDVDALLKEAESKLVFASEESDIEEKATSLEAMKAILPKDVELPKGTMMVIKHKLTTPREDRDRDVLRTEGATVDPKMPMLWQHMHTLPIGKRVATLTHTEKVLRLASVLLDLNELTADAAKLIEADVLRFSHGFIAKVWEDRFDKSGSWLGFDIKEFEIMEASLVSVPSNVDAEIELYSRDKLKSDVFKSHAAALFAARPVQVQGTDAVGSAVVQDTKTVEEPSPSESADAIVVNVDVEPMKADCGCQVDLKHDAHRWEVFYETGKTPDGTTANPESVSQLDDLAAVEQKGGRELSKANIKVLTDVHLDLIEIAADEGLSRGNAKLAERSRDAIKQLLDRVTGEEEDEDKTVAEAMETTDLSAAVTVLKSQDTELKRRVYKGLQTLFESERRDKRAEQLRKSIGRKPA